MTPETSVGVPPEDPAALAAAVESLLADEPRRHALGEAARELAISEYGWPDIAARLEAVYESASGRTPAAAAA